MFEQIINYGIVLVLGNYGAGKSSLAAEAFPERMRINRHEIRHGLKEMTEYGARWTPEDWNEDHEGLVKHIEYDIICHYLERDKKILVDNTSVTKKSRKRYIDLAKKYRKKIACIFLNPDISVLIKQNRMRQYPVPDRIIVDLYSKTEVPDKSEGFDTLLFVN
ncbi:MAG: AAA family ATPase [Spirochaetes bacterium]|nr:AAA family ATPase [Spirochaetota bacterium]